MQKREVDVAVIGAGSAGLSAYRSAVKQGARAVVIESGPYGTTCARHACMPSKLLIAAANATHETQLLDTFGITLDTPPRVDGVRVLQRVRRERDRFVNAVIKEVDSSPEQDKIHGRARFLSDQLLQIDDSLQIQARAIVLATGATATIPDAYRGLGDALAISDDVFEWEDLPASVAVVGTGVIAIELGQALSRLGVEVVMFGHAGSIASISDPAIADYALATFRRELPIHLDAQVEARPAPGGRAELSFVDAEGQHTRKLFDKVLVATGRVPALAHLGLENTSARRDDHGVPIFDADTLQCGTTSIFIAGDANHQRPWLNDAANEGRIAGEGAAAWPEARPQSRPTVLSIMFSDPAVISVGARWQTLNAHTTVIGKVSFENQGRSRVTQHNHGLLHVYADTASGRVLGAEGIAPAGEHLAHLIAWSVQQELTVDQMLSMPFYHPVFEEGLRTAVKNAMKARATVLACGEASLADSIGT